MKRSFVLFAVPMLVSRVAMAHPPYLGETDNEIGIFVVENPTAESAQDDACYMGSPGQFTAYVVLTNPFNQDDGVAISAVGGFEFRLVYPAGLFVTPTLHPSATNFTTPPDFYAGCNIPMNGGNQATLITLTIGTFTADPAAWFLTPVTSVAPSIPDGMAITDANDDFSLAQAYPTSGSYDVPVFGMFECTDVVPNEDVSWGSMKTLFK